MKKALTYTAGLSTLSFAATAAPKPKPQISQDLLFVGPREGYSPQIGAMVAMLNYMRHTIVNTVKNLSVEELDWQLDDKSNSIGALLLHLAATDKFYQLNSFEGKQEFNKEEDKIWGAAMRLGPEGRKITGHTAQHYLDILTEVRQETLERLKTYDDEWLLAKDEVWSQPGQDVNTYWKWFHVCEHESNHGGQMRILRTRVGKTLS